MAADPLLLEFAAGEPRELAMILAGGSSAELLELLKELPPADAASVASHLSSRQAAPLLQRLPAADLAELLTSADHAHALSLISLMQVADYEPVLEAASSAQRKRLRRLFDLPSRSLAAFASPEFIRVDSAASGRKFKKELESQDQVESLPIYVVDDRGLYLGEVRPQALLAKLPEHLRLRELATQVTPLTERMKIEAALKVEEWRGHSALPVVDLAGHLLGVVDHQTLLNHAELEEGDGETLARSVLDVAMRFLDLYEDCARLLAGRASR